MTVFALFATSAQMLLAFGDMPPEAQRTCRFRLGRSTGAKEWWIAVEAARPAEVAEIERLLAARDGVIRVSPEEDGWELAGARLLRERLRYERASKPVGRMLVACGPRAASTLDDVADAVASAGGWNVELGIWEIDARATVVLELVESAPWQTPLAFCSADVDVYVPLTPYRADLWIPAGRRHPAAAFAEVFAPPRDDGGSLIWAVGGTKPVLAYRRIGPKPLISLLEVDSLAPVADDGPAPPAEVPDEVKIPFLVVASEHNRASSGLQYDDEVVLAFAQAGGSIPPGLLGLLDDAQANIHALSYACVVDADANQEYVHYVRGAGTAAANSEADRVYVRSRSFVENKVPIFLNSRSRFRPDLERLLESAHGDLADRITHGVRSAFKVEEPEDDVAAVLVDYVPELPREPRYRKIPAFQPLADAITPIFDRCAPALVDEQARRLHADAPTALSRLSDYLERVAGDAQVVLTNEARDFFVQIDDLAMAATKALESAAEDLRCVQAVDESLDKALAVVASGFDTFVTAVDAKRAKLVEASVEWSRRIGGAVTEKTAAKQGVKEALFKAIADARASIEQLSAFRAELNVGRVEAASVEQLAATSAATLREEYEQGGAAAEQAARRAGETLAAVPAFKRALDDELEALARERSRIEGELAAVGASLEARSAERARLEGRKAKLSDEKTRLEAENAEVARLQAEIPVLVQGVRVAQREGAANDSIRREHVAETARLREELHKAAEKLESMLAAEKEKAEERAQLERRNADCAASKKRLEAEAAQIARLRTELPILIESIRAAKDEAASHAPTRKRHEDLTRKWRAGLLIIAKHLETTLADLEDAERKTKDLEARCVEVTAAAERLAAALGRQQAESKSLLRLKEAIKDGRADLAGSSFIPRWLRRLFRR